MRSEMFLYPNDFSLWQPVDSIAIFKLIALQMTGHIDAEVTHAKTLLALEDQELISALFSEAPGKPIIRLQNLEKVS